MKRTMAFAVLAATALMGLIGLSASPASAHGNYSWVQQKNTSIYYYAPGGPRETFYSRCMVNTHITEGQTFGGYRPELFFRIHDNAPVGATFSECNLAPVDPWGSFVQVIYYDGSALQNGQIIFMSGVTPTSDGNGNWFKDAWSTGPLNNPVFGGHLRITNDAGVIWDWDIRVM